VSQRLTLVWVYHNLNIDVNEIHIKCANDTKLRRRLFTTLVNYVSYEVRLPEFKSPLYDLLCDFSYQTPLCLSFLIFKMGMKWYLYHKVVFIIK